ncbi:MAG: hypothetical protein LBV74_08265 [Tannerella sp.]|jgi:hypothetical protein|nr:hypothetical protein [Tannerella sp.]
MRVRSIFIIALLAFLLHPVFAENALRERVYVHTDKQTYLSGELLWMKLYLTNEAGKPVSFSKVGYVELLDETTAHIQVKLEIINGIAEGWMELPVTLPTGNYRMIAYTRNMRNEDESVFFNKTIGIINTFQADASVGIDTVPPEISVSLDDSNIPVTTGQQTYTTCTPGEIRIQGLPEDIHSLSVAVTGRDFIPASEDIRKWSSRLDEYSNTTIKSDFLPEYEGHIISGRITDVLTGQPPVNENVYSLLGFIGDQVRTFGAMMDGNNNVRFITRRISGVQELAVTSVALSDKKCRVDIETPFALHSEKTLSPYVLNPDWEKQLLQRSVGLQVQHAYLGDSIDRMDTTYSYFQWKPDRSYILDEYTRFTTMEEIVIEFIPSLRFRRYNNKRFLSVLLNDNDAFSLGNTLVLLDGIPIIDHEIIFNYNPLLLYKIDVYRDKFVFGNKRFEGMVFLTTYKRDYPTLVTDETTHLFDYEGTQARRHFFSPYYPKETERGRKTPDFRHTLLWKPDVEPDGQSSISIPFSTSELTGEFQVTVEGLTKDGKAIRGLSFFNVINP